MEAPSTFKSMSSGEVERATQSTITYSVFGAPAGGRTRVEQGCVSYSYPSYLAVWCHDCATQTRGPKPSMGQAQIFTRQRTKGSLSETPRPLTTIGRGLWGSGTDRKGSRLSPFTHHRRLMNDEFHSKIHSKSNRCSLPPASVPKRSVPLEFSATARDERDPDSSRGHCQKNPSRLGAIRSWSPFCNPLTNATKPRMCIMGPPNRPGPFPSRGWRRRAGLALVVRAPPPGHTGHTGQGSLRGKTFFFVEADRSRHDGRSWSSARRLRATC